MDGETKHNVKDLFKSLLHQTDSMNKSKNEKEKQEEMIVKTLDGLLKMLSSNEEDLSDVMVDESFICLLSDTQPLSILKKSPKVIAELAKSEDNRKKCSQNQIVGALLKLLSHNNNYVLIQALRALGNICYENEEGKKLVGDGNGLERILTVFKRAIDLENTEEATLLRSVTIGCLLNFLAEQESLESGVEEQVIPLICKVLEIDFKTEIIKYSLMLLDVFNEAELKFMDEKLIAIMVKILNSEQPFDVLETCVDSLHDQAANEETKILFAKSGLCEILLTLLDKYKLESENKEIKDLLMKIVEILNSILTEDESMNYLYSESNGQVYEKLVNWLDSSNEKLQFTAALAMGNFARSDDHCVEMIVQDIDKKLLHLLSRNNSADGDVRLQQVLLSALRNLVIPAENKAIVLSHGLVDVLYPMIFIPYAFHNFHILFALLGTMRIISHKQQEEVKTLAKREGLVEKIVEWCAIDDNPGIPAEATRLLASLITNSADKEVVLSVIKYDGVKYLIEMLSSKHLIMQNEAILSLTILSTLCLSEAEHVLIRENIGYKLLDTLNDYSKTMPSAVLSNAIVLTLSLLPSTIVKEHLKNAEIMGAWENLKTVRDLKELDLEEKLNELFVKFSNTMSVS